MKLNCKPGDLAIVVSGAAVGAIVRCVERFDGPWFDGSFEAGWMIDRVLPTLVFGSNCFRVDRALRPIRDNDGEDETLQWLEVPRKVAA